MLGEILNVVQVFTPAHAVTVCYCCYCCSAVSKQKMPKNPGKTRKYLGFSGYFRVLPALDAGDRRGSLPGLPYCCSAGLTLATVVGEPHCCSVVTVNTSNTIQLLTFDNPIKKTFPWVIGSDKPSGSFRRQRLDIFFQSAGNRLGGSPPAHPAQRPRTCLTCRQLVAVLELYRYETGIW